MPSNARRARTVVRRRTLEVGRRNARSCCGAAARDTAARHAAVRRARGKEEAVRGWRDGSVGAVTCWLCCGRVVDTGHRDSGARRRRAVGRGVEDLGAWIGEMGKGKKKKKSKIDSDWDEEDPLKGEKSRKGGKKKDKKRKKGDSAGGNGLVVALVIAVALAAAYFMGWLPGSKTRPGATSDQSREGAGGATETQGYEESVADTKYSFGK